MIRIFSIIFTVAFAAGAAFSQPTSLPPQANPKAAAHGFNAREQAVAHKMQGGLFDIVGRGHKGLGLQQAAGKANEHAIRDGKLQVILVVDNFTDDLRNAAKAAGLEIVGEFAEPGNNKHLVVRASTTDQLTALLARPDVKVGVPEPRPITRTGAVSSQGDNSFRAPLARSTYSVDGTGVRVGVISDTFNRTIGGTALGLYTSGLVSGSTPQQSNDLPATVRVRDSGPTSGATDEGGGMAEIIHDVAPGAAISFASAWQSYSKFAQNITNLRTDPGYECNIIVDDVGYYSEPIYQNGLIAVAANQAAAAGVPYFSAIGNDYNDAHEALFTDTNATSDTAYPPSGVDLHDFGTAKGAASDKFLTFVLRPGDSLTAILRWDEPGAGAYASGPGASSDLDLYIVGSTALPLLSSNILASSTSNQGVVGAPTGEPYEAAQYANDTGANKTVHVCVDHYEGRTGVRMHLWAFTNGPYSNYTDRALDSDRVAYGHPTASGVMGVAAVRYKEIDTNGNDRSPNGTINVESYSSLAGNLPFLISDDGLTRYGSPQYVYKPDIAAPDGGNTTFFGGDDDDADVYPNFYGTSAAAPHAAAVAALLKQANPALTVSQVYSILKSTARDIESAGVDAYSGSGLVDALNAVASAQASVPGDIALSTSNLAFGNVDLDSPSDKQFYIRNTGGQALQVNSLTGLNNGFALINAPSLPFSIAAGTSQALTIRFTPPGLGAANSTLTIGSDDPDEPNVQVTCTGTGVQLPPALSLSSSNYDFGDKQLGQNKDQSFTINNDGDGALHVSGLTGLPSNDFGLQAAPAGAFTVPAHSSQKITVRFLPSSTGSRNATLTINSDDPSQPTAGIQLSGTGVDCFLADQETSATSDLDLLNVFTGTVTAKTDLAKGTQIKGKLTIAQLVLGNGITPTAGVPPTTATLYLVDTPVAPCTLPTAIGQAAVKPGKPGKPGKAAKSSKVAIKLALPATPTTGKYLMAIVDQPNSLPERDKANNIAIAGPLP